MARRVEIGSGSVRNSGWFGGRYDYEYDVPEGAFHVAFTKQDGSDNGMNFGSGNGNGSLKWDKGSRKAYVHAWVNGKAWGTNRISWTVSAWVRE